MLAMRNLAIVANCGKERAAGVLRRVAVKSGGLGLRLFADPATAALLGDGRMTVAANLFDEVDAVMALGGDGTLLRVVRELDGRDVPVIGVNLGGLGFLTSVSEEELDAALESLAAGRVTYAVHAIAECRAEREGATPGSYRALNDVVVTCGTTARVVTLDVAVDGDHVSSYVCDGLIVATPAGSTGHSLSAGGPILVPETGAFVISLICPHTLSSRPLVVSDRSVITITAQECVRPLLLSVDGQVGQPLQQGDRVIVRRSERSVRLIHLPGYTYFGVLRQKLHWRGSSAR
jgi:NAD+ kinase